MRTRKSFNSRLDCGKPTQNPRVSHPWCSVGGIYFSWGPTGWGYSTNLNGKIIPNLNRFGSILYIVYWPVHGYSWISRPNPEVGSG